jgi:hypothetical protein
MAAWDAIVLSSAYAGIRASQTGGQIVVLTARAKSSPREKIPGGLVSIEIVTGCEARMRRGDKKGI